MPKKNDRAEKKAALEQESTDMTMKKDIADEDEFTTAISDFRFKNLNLQIPKIGTAKKASETYVEIMKQKKFSTNQIKNNAYLIIEMGSRVLNVKTIVNFDKGQLDFLGKKTDQTIYDGSADILRFDKLLNGTRSSPEIQKLEDFIRENEKYNIFK